MPLEGTGREGEPRLLPPPTPTSLTFRADVQFSYDELGHIKEVDGNQISVGQSLKSRITSK